MNKVIGLLLVGFVVMSSSCKKTQDFQFKKIVSWRINNLNFTSGNVAAKLLFYNPNRFSLTFKHLEGSVALEGKDFGYCVSDTTLKIGPEQNFILPVTINLKSGATLSAGFALMTKDSVQVGFDGYARAGRAGIFINYKFKAVSKVATSFDFLKH